MTQTATTPSRSTRSRSVPLRVALVGCGAISQRFHLPVLAGHEGIELTTLVDRDLERASRCARAYGVPHVLGDANTLTTELVDAALVATPPFHHAPCCITLANRGIHVLVEKPMSITVAEATAMAAAAADSDVTLSAAYFRRLFPAVRLLRAALEREALGRILSVDVEEGDEYGWGLTTLDGLRKDRNGGGVLIDIGSHVLDLLLELFPGEPTVVSSRHNALGGVETDCEVHLTLRREDQSIPTRVELSRTRKLRNTLRIQCDRGSLELRVGERYHVNVILNDGRLIDPVNGEPREVSLDASWASESEATGYEAYRAVVDDWLVAIKERRAPRLDAASATRTVRLIENCHDQAESLDEPWIFGGIGRSRIPSRSGSRSPNRRRVLVTGATGFIGGRLAEVLHLSGRYDVRALVHRPAAAARLARLPIELVPGNLTSSKDLARAVEGCEAVFHCAVGTAYGRRGEIFSVTEGGTRKLADASRSAGVARFVHLSSVAVLGDDPRGIFDEQTPVRPQKGSDYAESKAAAEKRLVVAARKGLSVVILRPGCVYGPYSRTFTTRPVESLKRGRLVLAGCADRPSNTVYVDNLVDAMILSAELDSPDPLAIYTISDGDDMTWGEFYGYFAEELGAQIRLEPAPERKDHAAEKGVLKRATRWYRGGVDVLRSPELRSFGRRILQTDPIGTVPRRILERHPAIEQGILKRLGGDAAVVYRRQSLRTESDDVVRFTAQGGAIRVDKAREELGYGPVVSREESMGLTLAWLKAARIG